MYFQQSIFSNISSHGLGDLLMSKNNILLKRKKITLDGSINPHKWITYSERETANVMPEGYHWINNAAYKNWTYALIQALHCVWRLAHRKNLRVWFSFMLQPYRRQIKPFLLFYCCSTFLLHFVTKLEWQLSMFCSIPILLHIFSSPYGGVRYNLKNGISIRVGSYYSCGSHFTEKTAHFTVCQCIIVTGGAENSMFVQLLKWYFNCGIESPEMFKE